MNEGIRADQYRAELGTMRPETVWSMLDLAVAKPEDIPDGHEWRVPVIRLRLILWEWSGWEFEGLTLYRFPADPAVIGLSGADARRWAVHSARRYDKVGTA